MKILAIETSCDETAAAVVEDGHRLLSNVVATQIELHRRFGGVFPEVASRQHVLAIAPVIRDALEQAGLASVADVDAIAVTNGPGLAGSLLVGVNAAKGLAFGADKPLIGVNHIEGHIYSNWVEVGGAAGTEADTEADTEEKWPILVMIISGGHTTVMLMRGHCQYEELGSTLDDAAGEAFDKVARLLELGFPGGPAIQRAAETGNPEAYPLPRALLGNPEHRYDFSFSGLKTAVLNLTRQLQREGVDALAAPVVNDIAASFQAAVADVLVEKLARAAKTHKVQRVCICGGVSANSAVRRAAQSRFTAMGIPLSIPPLFLCTDNAAMIGAAAYHRYQASGTSLAQFTANTMTMDVFANLPLVAELQAT